MMKNTEPFTLSVTQVYCNMVMHRVQSENPGLKPGQGQIYYDEDNEEYVYSGFTEEELSCVKNVVSRLMQSTTEGNKAA